MNNRRRIELRYRTAWTAALGVSRQLTISELTRLYPHLQSDMIRLTGIDKDVMSAWEIQWQPPRSDDRGDFDWRAYVDDYRREPGYFDLAIWYGDILCGLGLGLKDGNRVDVCLMESHPDPAHPLKGLVRFIVNDCAMAFALACDVSRLRLRNPLPALLPLYERMGFHIVERRNESIYCEKEV